jgi:hypothetical protein
MNTSTGTGNFKSANAWEMSRKSSRVIVFDFATVDLPSVPKGKAMIDQAAQIEFLAQVISRP